MRIEVLYVEDCPNYPAILERLRTALREEGLSNGISRIEVKDAPAAKRLRFPGSPTIRIDGHDLGGATETIFACRWNPADLPSKEAIRKALREAQEQSDPGRRSGAGTTFASLAAIGSVLAASSCCLPVLPFLMAAGLAGGAAFLSAASPYLLGASVLFIAFGFYQGWRAKKCHRRQSVISSVLLWISTVFVIVSIFFPQAMANAAAGWLVR